MRHQFISYASMLVCTTLIGGAAGAQTTPTTYEVEDSFDNVTFAVENAILGAGLIVEHVSHVGEMLERTRVDIGSDRVLFTQADVYSFCSAKISRQVMEADPSNIQFCPYGIFVYELADKPGTVVVGHRSYDGTMAPVQELMTTIISDAVGSN